MRRARVALLAGLAALAFATACSPEGPGPAPEITLPPPPTAPVGANGQPIANLCELLDAKDFTDLAGLTASAPDTSKVTNTLATCEYGQHTRLTVTVAPSADEAATAYAAALQSRAFLSREAGTIGGVDESVSGTGPETIGVAVRRRMLVFTIELPGATQEGKSKLIMLSGTLLSRAHALGT